MEVFLGQYDIYTRVLANVCIDPTEKHKVYVIVKEEI